MYLQKTLHGNKILAKNKAQERTKVQCEVSEIIKGNNNQRNILRWLQNEKKVSKIHNTEKKACWRGEEIQRFWRKKKSRTDILESAGGKG